MTTTFKEKQEIQKLKKLGLGKTEIAKKLKTSRVTVYKYWDWEPPSETQVKNAKSISEKTEEATCPNCNKLIKFAKTDKKVRCPNCNKLLNIIRENNNNDEQQEGYKRPWKYSTEIPRRRRGISLRRLFFIFIT